MKSGPKSTIETHPKSAEIRKKLILRTESLKKLAEDYGISVSSLKRYRAKIEPDPRKRNEAEQKQTPAEYSYERREEFQEAHKEAVATAAPVKAPDPPQKPVEYAPGSTQYEPLLKLRNDPDWRPGFQSVQRQQKLEQRLMAEKQAERARNYNPLDW